MNCNNCKRSSVATVGFKMKQLSLLLVHFLSFSYNQFYSSSELRY